MTASFIYVYVFDILSLRFHRGISSVNPVIQRHNKMVHLRGLFFFSESSLSIAGVDFDIRCSWSTLPPAAALSAPGVAIMLHDVSVFDRSSLSAVGSSSCSSAHPSPSQQKPFSSIMPFTKNLYIDCCAEKLQLTYINALPVFHIVIYVSIENVYVSVFTTQAQLLESPMNALLPSTEIATSQSGSHFGSSIPSLASTLSSSTADGALYLTTLQAFGSQLLPPSML